MKEKLNETMYVDNGESLDFEKSLSLVFKNATENNEPLFTVETEGLWEVYLSNIEPLKRQYYNCNTCKRFIRIYGGIVTINADGVKQSSLFDVDKTPETFRESVVEMVKIINKSKVKSLFVNSEKMWGVDKCNGWSHLYIMPDSKYIYRDRIKTPFQTMSESKEEFSMLSRALGEYSVDCIKSASAIIKSETLDRSNQYSDFIKGLLELKKSINIDNADNKKWLAIAKYQNGFAHFKNTMIGTLLDDINSGLSLDIIKRKFNEKVDSINFQRPKAFPNKGNLERADEIVKKLGLEKSFERRFATIDDIRLSWKPPVILKNEKSEGLFKSLISEKKIFETSDFKNVSLNKFLKDILPTAESVDIYCNGSKQHFCCMTTAKEEDAEPIFKWDLVEDRYPVSWYVYHGGSTSEHFNLNCGWNKIKGVTEYPKYSNINGVIFLIDNCKDTQNRSLGIFPECLRSELREVRSSVEALSQKSSLSGYENASACGLAKSSDQVIKVKVLSDGVSNVYNIGVLE